jgi:hypothetical protein
MKKIIIKTIIAIIFTTGILSFCYLADIISTVILKMLGE